MAGLVVRLGLVALVTCQRLTAIRFATRAVFRRASGFRRTHPAEELV